MIQDNRTTFADGVLLATTVAGAGLPGSTLVDLYPSAGNNGTSAVNLVNKQYTEQARDLGNNGEAWFVVRLRGKATAAGVAQIPAGTATTAITLALQSTDVLPTDSTGHTTPVTLATASVNIPTTIAGPLLLGVTPLASVKAKRYLALTALQASTVVNTGSSVAIDAFITTDPSFASIYNQANIG